MANGKQTTAKRKSMAERAQQQREIHFPNVASAFLWHRRTNDGYTTLPRTLPIAIQAIDAQSKGQPAGHTLFCLWARSPDHVLVTVENPSVFACEAGFSGERAVDTWRKRMKKLRELGFVLTKPGPSGEFHYVLLINPNVALEELRIADRVQDGLYGRFVDRLADIGAFGDLEAIREYKKNQAAGTDAANAAASPPPPNRQRRPSR